MALFGLFGKGSGKQAREPEKPEEDLELYSGLQVDVISIGGQPLFTARLLGVRGDSGQLSQSPGTPQLRVPEGDPLSVYLRGYSSKDARAVYLQGTIALRSDRLWLVKRLTLVKAVNDRAFFRVDTNLAACIEPAGRTGAAKEPCRLLDLSVGGARIRAAEGRWAGEKFPLCIQLHPGWEPITILCQVLHVTPRDGGRAEYGCCFLELKPSDEEKITQAIFEIQRQRRAGP